METSSDEEDIQSVGSKSADDEMLYREDNYPSKEYNLRRNDSLCDVVLQVDDTEFPVHKIILTSLSSYFKIMYQEGKYVESKQNVILLKDIEVESMRSLLDYAYSGSIKITESNCESLLKVADFLEVIPVRNAVCKFLKRKMDNSNCLGIYAFAQSYACTELQQKARNFALKNFRDVSQTEEFLDLTAEKVVELTSSDRLEVEKEEYVFLAIKRWVDKKPEERTTNFHKLLETVRLSLIDPQFLCDNIQTFPAVNLNEECMKMIEEAKCPPNKRCKERVFNDVLFGVYVYDSTNEALTECACYCPITDNWCTLPSLPSKTMARSGFVACEKNYLYLAGGELLDRTTSNRFWRYNADLHQWQEMASMLTRKRSLGLAVLDGCIYAVGGCNDRSRVILDTIERYNPNSNEWSFVRKLEKPIMDAAVSVYENMLYVIGGIGYEGYSNRVHRYDPGTDTWAELAPMTNSRSDAVSCVLDGFIYIIGGCTANVERTNLAERFDIKNNRWESIEYTKRCCHYLGVAVVKKKIYAIGRVFAADTAMECYNTKLKIWDTIFVTNSRVSCIQKMVPLKIPRRFLTA